jgi:uncharacterized protein
MSRVVYLHGFASGPTSSKARYFRQLCEAAGHTVEVPDLAEGDFEHLTVTGQLSAIERAAGGGAVTLMGSSLGGYLAALHASQHSEVERLVLLAPAFGLGRRWAERIGPEEVAKWRRDGSIPIYHYGEQREIPLRFDFLEDALRYEDYPDARQPALIFHGLHDDVVPAEASQEFCARHPEARLELLDSGHELLDVLDTMGPQVIDFLRGQTRPR